MALPIIQDLVAEGLDRLVYQWRDKPIVQGLLTSYLENVQPLEDVNFQLLDERGVYSAVGVQLDTIGLLVGELRRGRGDVAYRQAILNRIVINNSDGTPESILETLTIITLTPTPKIWDHYPASFHAFVDRNVSNETSVILATATPAGVNSRLMFDRRGNSFVGTEVIGADFDFVLENLDDLEVDVGVETATLSVTNNTAVQLNDNSFLPDLLNIQVINPLCEVIISRDFNVEVGSLLLENLDSLALENGDVMGYQILDSDFIAVPLPLPFITTWDTTLAGSAADTIELPLGVGSFDFDVDWGDGGTENVVSAGSESITHVYSVGGTYDVSITGTFPHIRFNNTGDKAKITDVSAWGGGQFSTFEGAFYGCSALDTSAIDSPIMLAGARTTSMFRNANTFNGDISSWDVSSVTDMRSMFSSATSFNQNIGAWDVSSVTDMGSLFSFATAFNQNIGAWDVSSVTDMRSMFLFATAFNQNIGAWDVSSVTHMASMLNSSDLNQTNYDALLVGWSALTLQSSVILGASGLNYTASPSAAATARDVLTDPPNSWSISGDTPI
jgi:surface protein